MRSTRLVLTVSLAAGCLFAAAWIVNAGRAAIPNANKVTLAPTANMASKSGCAATAWVGYVDTSGQQFPLKGYTVNFVKVSGNGNAPSSGVSDANGFVKRTVPAGMVVKATVQSTSLLVSSNFTCASQNPTN